MKKKLAIVLATIMVLSLTACGSSANEGSQTSSAAGTTSTTSGTTGHAETSQGVSIGLSPVEAAFHPATSGSYATIKVDSSVPMDDETGWLGLCPAGKDYITELEADEVDEIWFNYDTREADTDPYVFACDFEPVADGTYALVVATSDDENVGYVVIQLTMEKKGDKLTFDYSDAKLKERPAK